MKKVLTVLLLLSGASAAYGEIYTWRNTRGTLFYTNSLHEIPARYLKKARVLDVATGKKGGLATAQPVGQTAPATSPGQTPAAYPVATPPSPVPSAAYPVTTSPSAGPSAATPEIVRPVPSSAPPAAVVARPRLNASEARGQTRKERRRMRSQTEEE